MTVNSNMRLVVEVKARLDFLTEAKDAQERLMREQAQVMAHKAGTDVQQVAALVVSMLLAERARYGEEK